MWIGNRRAIGEVLHHLLVDEIGVNGEERFGKKSGRLGIGAAQVPFGG